MIQQHTTQHTQHVIRNVDYRLKTMCLKLSAHTLRRGCDRGKRDGRESGAKNQGRDAKVEGVGETSIYGYGDSVAAIRLRVFDTPRFHNNGSNQSHPPRKIGSDSRLFVASLLLLLLLLPLLLIRILLPLILRLLLLRLLLLLLALLPCGLLADAVSWVCWE